jgi:hypothetical protein
MRPHTGRVEHVNDEPVAGSALRSVLGRERSDDEFLVEYVENELEVAHV